MTTPDLTPAREFDWRGDLEAALARLPPPPPARTAVPALERAAAWLTEEARGHTVVVGPPTPGREALLPHLDHASDGHGDGDGEGGTADTVVLDHALLHVDDPGALVAQAARRLAPGGRLVVAVPLAGDGTQQQARTLPPVALVDLIDASVRVTAAIVHDDVIRVIADRAAQPPPRTELLIGLLDGLSEAALTALRSHVDATAERDRTAARLDDRDVELQRLERETVPDLERRAAAAEAEAERLRSNLAATAAERDEAERRASDLEEERDRLRGRLDAVTSTRWWRLRTLVGRARPRRQRSQ